ncbi:hypothetical protein DZA65_02974 [Dickeya dianthicola]|uniref:Bacteriophage CI repressor N-terminal domain-containing protein n=1 Tax=Dickeya dianthicola TaxID=204039 RepID=A0ABX9NKD1_9GAMM|nr:helix-turn-helix domain-containing protein [Dickeya dianthicola]AYC19852.1 hypothetical protein DZA65_02974 [Dickeya dianthicola]MBI0436411.1 bacteriophage CI repressor [Dickeya dianthicola]MBI0447405.1 bacteriophage CI repressor [Dickeya dianthicola]MBI0451780.1 bacteriophage CI repressor [Dickeya dianthicola]MBI0456159.1 bacteriophage CI repressor [Dickeya dianthicola]
MRKEPVRSFETRTKEPVIQRVFQLVEHRYSSRSEAAKAWGINVNTLNNYYKRSELNPVPRKEQLQKIAACEGVSLEWLLTGSGEGIKKEERTKMNKSEDRLTEVLSFLTESERNSLAEVLARKGVETALCLLDEDNIKLLQLDQAAKAKILGAQSNAAAALNVNQSNVCDSDNEGKTTPDSLTRRA